MAKSIGVVTYRLAYEYGEVELCDKCVSNNTHGKGVLGCVQEGEHAGTCDGDAHCVLTDEDVITALRELDDTGEAKILCGCLFTKTHENSRWLNVGVCDETAIDIVRKFFSR
jgi:hypothetical protein